MDTKDIHSIIDTLLDPMLEVLVNARRDPKSMLGKVYQVQCKRPAGSSWFNDRVFIPYGIEDSESPFHLRGWILEPDSGVLDITFPLAELRETPVVLSDSHVELIHNLMANTSSQEFSEYLSSRDGYTNFLKSKNGVMGSLRQFISRNLGRAITPQDNELVVILDECIDKALDLLQELPEPVQHIQLNAGEHGVVFPDLDRLEEICDLLNIGVSVDENEQLITLTIDMFKTYMTESHWTRRGQVNIPTPKRITYHATRTTRCSCGRCVQSTPS